jgi:ligand-binding sensor domain-containing protein
VARDLNENIWFATQKGISRFDGAEWKSYTTADGLAGDWVTDIEVDLNGDVWFAHMPGGVSKLNVTLPN